MQPVAVAARDAEFLQHGFGQRVGALAGRDPDRGAALDHGAVEQAARRRHRQQDADLPAAARLAEDRDIAGIAAERLDIVAHPFERGDEVEHPGIAGMRVALAADIGEVQKAEDVEAMVDADHDDIAAPRQVGAVGHRAVARAVGEGAAMQPDHDRPLRAVADAGRPDVQRQAILALRGSCRPGRGSCAVPAAARAGPAIAAPAPR